MDNPSDLNSAEQAVRAVYPNAFLAHTAEQSVCIIADDTGRRVSNWCLTADDAWANALYWLTPKPAAEPAKKKPKVRVMLSANDNPQESEKPVEVEQCDLFGEPS